MLELVSSKKKCLDERVRLTINTLFQSFDFSPAGFGVADSCAGFTFSVGKTEISVIFFVFGEHRDTNFGPESL